MRLKSLELQGYKSFANKVAFIFDEGITAVVGPNGSGKSNVADAIRWALGEQSYSMLRGKKTEDMIFSGSDGRARLGMAAVTLVLDNVDKWIPLDFSEVTISRRAYRSGENEYYLNGSRVRLRDVNEILAKSGLGRQTYTVIGQGMIDRVLALNADDRRQLFEEAANIIFHRQKRAETLAKLETTRDNLVRLNDIVKEIEPRMNRLERQAERADEYARLMSHLDGLLRVWYGYRWGRGQLQLRESTARLRESEAAVATQRGRLAQVEGEIAHIRSEQTALRAKLGTWYTENNQLYAQAETIQRKLAVNEERARQYAAQREEILGELHSLLANRDSQKQQVDEAQEKLVAINAELAQTETAKRAAQQRLDAHQSQRQAILARQTVAEKRIRQLATDLTERQTRLTQLGERRDSLLAEQETRQAEISRLTEQRGDIQARQAQLAAELAALDEARAALEKQQVEQQETLGQLNEAADEFKRQLSELQRREDNLRAHRDMLDRLRSEMTGYFEGVRAIVQENKLSGIVGTVSQVIRVAPDLEVAIETALGSRLQDVVVDSFAHAEAAIDYLKQHRKGRATLLPLDTIRPGRAVELPPTPGVIGRASDLIKIEEKLRPIAELTLNRTIVVDDLAAARRAFTEMQGGFQIVTREGELIRSGGAVTGGRSAGSRDQQGTLLARERELRELPRQIDEATQAQQSATAQLERNRQEAATVEAKLQALLDEQQQQDGQRAELQATINQVERSLEQLADSLGWHQDLQDKARAELTQLEQRKVDLQHEMVQLEQEQREAEETARQLSREVNALSAENLLAELNQAKNAVALIQGRQRSQQTILENYQTAYHQLSTQIESKQNRVDTLAAEQAALHQQRQALAADGHGFSQQLEQFTAQIGDTEKRLAELENRLQHQEQLETNLRHQLQRLESEHGRASLEAARRQDDLDNLERQIQDDLGLVRLDMSAEQVGQPVLPIRPLVSDLPVVEELPPGVEEDVKRLKLQVRRLGTINPEAPREYTELHERFDFLTGQMADLEAAAADLKEVMARLDKTMEEAFTDTFQKVAREFQNYFKLLFGGGEAQLLLTDPDNLIESGVDIAARPPGKRLQSLALLSGGERSLTAQALIFALLRTSPTPFVIFDEVDAMLDEANVGRFREALAALARDIQFIVITHNRITIEAANTLYGISMGEDSVSRVYSIKIDDWLKDEASQKQK
ncbi:MAG: chromosome segregation protein SMC [Anaerolineae bacterium]|nr:chromosome segregation protein SMC [Anaerolineae bacterium]